MDALMTVYDRIGEEGFARIASGFYERVRKDEVIGPMYEKHLAATGEEWAAAEARLRDFLVGRCGGPPRYIEQRGHPRLRMRHMPFAIDVDARNRWVTMMQASMDDADLPADVYELLQGFFAHTATFMINRDG